MASRYTDAQIDRLAQERHETLLRALIESTQFRYSDLARLTGRKVNAITTQFTRWDQLGLKLRESVGSAKPTGRGKPQAVFQLVKGARAAIEEALEFIEQDRAAAQGANYDDLPSLGGLREMLQRAWDVSLDRSVRYHSANIAAQRYGEALTRLLSDPAKLGFRPSEPLIAKVKTELSQAESYTRTVLGEIRSKSKDLVSRAQKIRASLATTHPEDYFRHLEYRSISGYGGALFARAHSYDYSELDAFLAKSFDTSSEYSQSELANRIHVGFSHALSEVVELMTIAEPEWCDPTMTIFEGAEFCVPVSELPAMREAAGKGFGALSKIVGPGETAETAQDHPKERKLLDRFARIDSSHRPRGGMSSWLIQDDASAVAQNSTESHLRANLSDSWWLQGAAEACDLLSAESLRQDQTFGLAT